MTAFEVCAMRSAVETCTRFGERTKGLPPELRPAFLASDQAVELAVRCCDASGQATPDGSRAWDELASWMLVEFTPLRGWHVSDALVGEYLRRCLR